MIETGPQEAAQAAWDALSEAVERSKHIAPTGDADLDKAVRIAHLKAIYRLGLKHVSAVDALWEAMGG